MFVCFYLYSMSYDALKMCKIQHFCESHEFLKFWFYLWHTNKLKMPRHKNKQINKLQKRVGNHMYAIVRSTNEAKKANKNVITMKNHIFFLSFLSLTLGIFFTNSKISLFCVFIIFCAHQCVYCTYLHEILSYFQVLPKIS